MKSIGLSILFAASAFCADKPLVVPIAPQIDDPRSVTVGERSVVPINVCQLQNTILVLPEHELTRSTYVADTENWVLETTKANQASRFLSLKVKKPLTAETTLNVISDHDSSYTFRLVLVPDHCDSKVFIDADGQLAKRITETRPWASPDQVAQLEAQITQANKGVAAAQSGAAAQIDAFRSSYPSKLRFDYHFDQKVAEKMGIHEIFHDSKFTYVSATPQETPALYELKDGKPSLIAFDFKDGLYSTARIIDLGYLAVGGSGNGKHQEKLEFRRQAGEN
ncbi:MAG: TrbG/VirB9 family P-type conjugative transfer protein [Acidobacteriota bacterium]|nr:TrbG/VirB9 family P-type conjugative transfer protein [Acidobacteriota bacterium]